jgi:hypothetical protein
MRTPILNIDCNTCIFSPKRQQKIMIIHHSYGYLTNCPILSFFNPILLGIVRHNHLPRNPRSLIEIIILVGFKLFSIIYSENTDMSTCLILNKILKILKLTEGFMFSFHKINLGFMEAIINKNDIIKTTIHGQSSHRSTEIRMNKI